jgi:type IV pilus assembly protein PilW
VAADFQLATCAAGGTPALEINTIATERTTPLTNSGIPTDCLGRGVPADRRISHRYYLSTYGKGGGAARALYCASNVNGNVQPLVEGVDRMHFRYGVASNWTAETPGTRRPDAYVAAGGVTGWMKVVSVRVCVLMRSAEPVLGDEIVTNKYRDCQGHDITAGDLHLYRAFHGTFTIRERAAW